MNKNDANKITINFKRASGESVSLSGEKTDKPIDIIQQLKQKWPNFKVNQLVFNGNNILNGEKNWSELTKENNIMVYVCGLESLITVHFKKLGTEEGFDLHVKKDDKIRDIVPTLEEKFVNFKVAQLNLDTNNTELIWRGQDGKVNDRTWGELSVDNDINVIVCGKDIVSKDRIENKSIINWKFIFSSSPFLVLTLLALILQWHITFVIIFLIIGLVLIAIGLWPKIKTCCPRKISSFQEPENQNPSGEYIYRNPILNQDYQQNQNRNS